MLSQPTGQTASPTVLISPSTGQPPPALPSHPTVRTPKPPTSTFCLLDNLLVLGLQDAPGACGSAGSSLHRIWVEARGT